MIVIIRLMNLGSIPDQVSRHILEHFNVEGALPLTEDRGPYKVIQGFDLQPDGHDRINLSRARGVMNHLEGILTRELNIQDINRLGNPQFNNSMVEAYSILCRRLHPNQDLEAVRIYDKTYNTIYERLQLLKNRIPHDRNVGAAEE